MPSAAAITINNGAGTPVAKTFDLIAPAAGDGSSAKWALKEGTIRAVFPSIKYTARPNAAGNARKGLLSFSLPSSYTDSVTGLTKVGSGAQFNGEWTLPDDFPEALKNDFVAFTANLIATAFVKSLIRDGESAT